MSTASGITVSDEVREAFATAHKQQTTRCLKIQIRESDSRMFVAASVDPKGNWQEDLDLVPPMLDAKDSCYILYRMDAENGASAPQWILNCYVPDQCKVRQKMIYASTRAQLKLALGGGLFAHDIFGTVPADFGKSGFDSYLRMRNSAAPLTESEEAKAMETTQSLAEASAFVGAGGASSTVLHGVSFQPEDSARAAVKAIGQMGAADNYLQLSVDETHERIIVHESGTAELKALCDKVPLDRPAFHIFRYDHEHGGKSLSSLLMIYSCPDGSTPGQKAPPVKSRMVYSSCKNGVEQLIESEVGRRVDMKLEINAGSEITEQFITDKLHPPVVEKKGLFSKPKPVGHGARRLTSRTPTPTSSATPSTPPLPGAHQDTPASSTSPQP